MTQDAPLDQKADWRCAKCDCREFARMDTRLPDTSFGPGDFVRCVNCKDVSFFPDALSRRVPASGGELKGIAWSDLDYLMSIIDAAIEDGFDPDEDGPLLDQIRAELKAPTAASPRVTAPEGWRTVPEEPTQEMLEQGYDAYSALSGHGVPVMMDNAYRAMLAAAPSIPEGKAEPVIWLQFNATDGFTGLRRWTRDKDQAARWMAEDDAHKYRFEAYGAPVALSTPPGAPHE